MKIRKAIATAIIAATALAGTATAADAFNPQPEPPGTSQDDGRDQNPADDATKGEVYYRYELRNVLVSSYDTSGSQAAGTSEIDFVEVAGGSSEGNYGGSRAVYLKIELEN